MVISISYPVSKRQGERFVLWACEQGVVPCMLGSRSAELAEGWLVGGILRMIFNGGIPATSSREPIGEVRKAPITHPRAYEWTLSIRLTCQMTPIPHMVYQSARPYVRTDKTQA